MMYSIGYMDELRVSLSLGWQGSHMTTLMVQSLLERQQHIKIE
jgi:hypothetical protein